MRNPKLVPYETIIQATSGEPEAVDEVLRHYGKRIRFASLENGQVNRDTEDNIKRRLIAALLQFRFDEQPYKKTE
ncbi:helix-turn-helix domain-containing protein [Anaerotruncus colihominis]|uniref:Helix-turn-helix domain-containing protein n=1 Tax=Anaerotruncus colihominis TaxID=169435 RepID=A0A845SN12_9FIRM|nr:helix-turn-helix domain-containing protein [Anaerotruncus colihominis]NDO37816.1 helix-turn-helix domain-containing protein [Anaerotruncus colihominis]